jgi:hypothetical protein
MDHSVKLSDSAFKAYNRRARAIGLTVDEYLNQSAPQKDEYFLSPETKAAIEQSLAQADRGELHCFDAVRESLKAYRSEWQNSQNR